MRVLMSTRHDVTIRDYDRAATCIQHESGSRTKYGPVKPLLKQQRLDRWLGYSDWSLRRIRSHKIASNLGISRHRKVAD